MNDNIENNVTDLFTWGASVEPQEEWRPVLGMEDLYQVSNLGRVRNRRGRVLKSFRASKGAGRVEPEHAKVHLHDEEGNVRRKKVHVMVLEAFTGPRPEGMLGLHRDDDKENNAIENLYWGTAAENRADAVRNGVYARAAEARAEKRWRLMAA